jgi:antirestriction factor ArdC-like protein
MVNNKNSRRRQKETTHMKQDEINRRTKEAVDYLVESLQSGRSEVLVQYLAAMGRFHDYSFGNIMLIARQRPDATKVAGFRTWNSLGRFVNKGERGILILAPMVGRKREERESLPEETVASERQLFGFRAAYVFDRLSRDLWPSLCALDGCRRCHFKEVPSIAAVTSSPNSFASRNAPDPSVK